MAEKQIYLTKEGKESLEKELEQLVSVGRKEAAEKLKVARSFGDLSENSEYDEAKNDQAMLEARIADLEVMLKLAVVVNEAELNSENVNMGSVVTISTTGRDGSEITREFKIVGSNEADPRNGKISDESAVGKALFGQKVGSTVDVETAFGTSSYKIVSISR
ncbi:MAG: transcription elongation factor GreA [Clostridia bacterium]